MVTTCKTCKKDILIESILIESILYNGHCTECFMTDPSISEFEHYSKLKVFYPKWAKIIEEIVDIDSGKIEKYKDPINARFDIEDLKSKFICETNRDPNILIESCITYKRNLRSIDNIIDSLNRTYLELREKENE